MEKSKLYIVVSRSNTIPARLIRFYTKRYYNHVSIALDSEMRKAYSFGRRFSRLMLPGGFVAEGFNKGFYRHHPNIEIRILELPLTREQYATVKAKLAPMIAHPWHYKYQISTVYYTFRRRPCDRTDKFVCSSFVAYILQGILPIREHYSQAMPSDFLEFGLKEMYRGTVGEYRKLSASQKVLSSQKQ